MCNHTDTQPVIHYSIHTFMADANYELVYTTVQTIKRQV